MQKTGTLKKKGRRSLKTVSGLSSIPYDYEDDVFDIGIFSKSRRPLSEISNGKATSVNISRLLGQTKGRVTRDPGFHHFPTKVNDDNDDDKDLDNVENGLVEKPTRVNTEVNSDDLSRTVGSFPLSPITIKILRLIIFTASTSFFLPWKWNIVTKRIDLWKSEGLRKMQRIFCCCFLIQSLSILCFQLNIVRLNFSANYPSHRGTFQHMFVALWYIMHSTNLINSLVFGDRTRRYINGLLHLNEKYTARFVVDKGVHKEEKLWMVLCVVPEFWIHIPINTLNFILAPSAFYYLYSYIYTPESPFYFILPGILHELWFVASCVSGDILAVWALFSHANSLDYWLQESHKNNETGETREELRAPHTAVDVYKSLLVLTGYFNDCMSTFGIGICKCLGCVGFTLCAYVLIRTTSADFVAEFPGILAYIAGGPSCFSIAIIALSLSAKIYDLGIGFLVSWNNTRHKNLRCVLMGCPTIRIRMGSFYALSGQTIVTFFQIVIGYLIDCIITFS